MNTYHTQKQQVIDWLESGKTITPSDAVKMWKCYRLGGIIEKLNRENGMNIENLNPRGQGIQANYKLIEASRIDSSGETAPTTTEVEIQGNSPMPTPKELKIASYTKIMSGYPENHPQREKIKQQIERLR